MRSPRGWFLVLAPLVTAVLAWSSFEVVTREEASRESRIYWQERTEVQRLVEQLDAAVATILDREASTPYADFQPYVAHEGAITERAHATGVPHTVGGTGARGPAADDTLYLPSPLLLGEAQFANLGLDRFYFEFAPRDVRAETILSDIRAPSIPRDAEETLALALGHTDRARLAAERQELEALVRVIGPAGFAELASHPALNLSSPLKWSRSFTPLFVPRVEAPGARPELWLVRLVDHPRRGVRLQGVWFNWVALEQALVDLGATLVASGRVELRPLLEEGIATAPPGESTATNDTGTLKNLALAVRVVARTPPPAETWSATYTSLVGAWVVFLCALGAIDLALRRALALSERRARFASAVTHELRTPLTTLCMYTEMLDAGLVPEGERATYVATLRTEAERLAALVDNVLDHAGLESGRASERVELDLGPWLDAWLARDASAQRAGEGAPIERRGLEGALPVRVDVAGLERILMNLASNARRYGAPPFHIEVGADARHVWLDFIDAGAGIAAPERVFDAFVRGGASGLRADAGADVGTGSSTRGLGLGLALARDLARAMGGELELRSPGPGGARQAAASGSATGEAPAGKDQARTPPPTTFRLTLPRAPA